MKNLSLISFVGVGTDTDLNQVLSFEDDFGRGTSCEFSVLFSETKSLTKDKRYPDISFCKDFLQKSSRAAAYGSLHLCGSVIDKYLNQDKEVLDLCKNAWRIQLNLDISKYPDHDKLTDQILDPCHRYGHHVILQQNKTKAKFMEVFLKKANCVAAILHDSSGGFGREISKVEPPDSVYYTGYAGGIKPENVVRIVDLIEASNPNNTEYYIDMESGIRENNVFSLDKCRQVLDNLYK